MISSKGLVSWSEYRSVTYNCSPDLESNLDPNHTKDVLRKVSIISLPRRRLSIRRTVAGYTQVLDVSYLRGGSREAYGRCDCWEWDGVMSFEEGLRPRMKQSDQVSSYHYFISTIPDSVFLWHTPSKGISSLSSVPIKRSEEGHTTLNLVTFFPSFSSFSTSWSTYHQHRKYHDCFKEDWNHEYIPPKRPYLHKHQSHHKSID
jgi:hypothetical protein